LQNLFVSELSTNHKLNSLQKQTEDVELFSTSMDEATNLNILEDILKDTTDTKLLSMDATNKLKFILNKIKDSKEFSGTKNSKDLLELADKIDLSLKNLKIEEFTEDNKTKQNIDQKNNNIKHINISIDSIILNNKKADLRKSENKLSLITQAINKQKDNLDENEKSIDTKSKQQNSTINNKTDSKLKTNKLDEAIDNDKKSLKIDLDSSKEDINNKTDSKLKTIKLDEAISSDKKSLKVDLDSDKEDINTKSRQQNSIIDNKTDTKSKINILDNSLDNKSNIDTKSKKKLDKKDSKHNISSKKNDTKKIADDNLFQQQRVDNLVKITNQNRLETLNNNLLAKIINHNTELENQFNENKKDEDDNSTSNTQQPTILEISQKNNLMIDLAKSAITSLSENIKKQLEEYKPPLMKASFTLNPSRLGVVHVSIITRGNKVSIDINSSKSTMQLLADNNINLKNYLSDIGFHDINMNFSRGDNKDDNSKRQDEQNQKNSKSKLEEQDRDSFEILIPNTKDN
jgi:hypothetical protein